MTSESKLLFAKFDLRAVLEAHEAKMMSAIDAIAQKDLLGMDPPHKGR